jgi:hypothetical protein
MVVEVEFLNDVTHRIEKPIPGHALQDSAKQTVR